jgi:hypothetical protein
MAQDFRLRPQTAGAGRFAHRGGLRHYEPWETHIMYLMKWQVATGLLEPIDQ